MSGVTFTSNAGLFKSEMQEKIEIALEMCGLLGERYAKLLCPVDTGRLRNSISHAPDGNKAEYIGTNVEYAPYLEYGTVDMNAHPFLKPAVSKHEYEYREIIRQVLAQE